MKIQIRLKSFEGHQGRPGMVGGSLPKGTWGHMVAASEEGEELPPDYISLNKYWHRERMAELSKGPRLSLPKNQTEARERAQITLIGKNAYSGYNFGSLKFTTSGLEDLQDYIRYNNISPNTFITWEAALWNDSRQHYETSIIRDTAKNFLKAKNINISNTKTFYYLED